MSRAEPSHFQPQHLRTHRHQAGLSLRQLAHATGKDPAQISRWESGTETPNPSTIRILAHALGVPLTALAPPPTTPAKGLADLRTAVHLTQAEVAQQLNIAPDTYAKIERGTITRHTAGRINQLATVLHVDPQQILAALPRTTPRGPNQPENSPPTTAQVRSWARTHSIPVPTRGPLPPEVWAAWREAHPAGTN